MSTPGPSPPVRPAGAIADPSPAPVEHPNPARAVSRGWRLALFLLRRLPQGALSRCSGWLAERRIPGPLRGPMLGTFARVVGIETGEAEHPPEAYPSVSAYFTRRLRTGARRWPDDGDVPASPVDGMVGALGDIREGRLIQAKGLDYGVGELLASEEEGARFRDGLFVTLYLGPRHYHRIHAPLGGRITSARAVPGALLPVNLPSVASVPRLFPRNERLIVDLRVAGGGASAAVGEGTPDDPGASGGAGGAPEPPGDVGLVAVGAFNVGRISAAFEPSWNGPDGRGVTNRRGRRGIEERSYGAGIPVRRGEEIMTFHLGSTVILLFGPPVVRGMRLHPAVVPGAEIRLGDPLLARS